MGIKQILKQQPLVTVLLATYNGEKYLVEQLESLERQIGVSVSVVVNDDGSKDGTLDILNYFLL
jgi:glycosyltransferase involved in cell wall biosynthesis